MNKVALPICLTLVLWFTGIFNAKAQIEIPKEESASYEYIFERIQNVSLFIAPMVQYPLGNDTNDRMTGFAGAAIVNKEWYVGYYGLNEKNNDCEGCKQLSHSGIWLGYIINKNNQFHFTPSIKLGSGDYSGDNIFAISPQIGVEANIFKWAKAELGLSYRIINGLEETESIDSDSLNGLFLTLDLKLGWFANPLFGKSQ